MRLNNERHYSTKVTLSFHLLYFQFSVNKKRRQIVYGALVEISHLCRSGIYPEWDTKRLYKDP